MPRLKTFLGQQQIQYFEEEEKEEDMNGWMNEWMNETQMCREMPWFVAFLWCCFIQTQEWLDLMEFNNRCGI